MPVYQYFRHNYLYVQAKIHIQKQQNEKSENILTEHVNHVTSCSHSVTHIYDNSECEDHESCTWCRQVERHSDCYSYCQWSEAVWWRHPVNMGREDLWRKAGDGVFLNCRSQEMCAIDHAEHASVWVLCLCPCKSPHNLHKCVQIEPTYTFKKEQHFKQNRWHWQTRTPVIKCTWVRLNSMTSACVYLIPLKKHTFYGL